MMKLKSIIAILIVPLFLTGCFWGERVTVPPAYEGKVLTKNGYDPETYPPSSFRLTPCWTPGSVCEKLILVEKSDQPVKEEFTLFMPRNQLTMAFDLRMTVSIRDGKTDAILDRVPPQSLEGIGSVVALKTVYSTYAKPIIREAVRTVMAKYTIDEIASSREAVNAEIRNTLESLLPQTPIVLKTAGLAKIQYPDVITKRKEEAETNRIAIEQEEAKKQVALIQLQTELEKAKANRAVRRERAEAAAEENKIAAASITPEYLEWKKLEVLEALASSQNATFIPFEALGTVGLQQKIFAGKSQ